MAAPKASSITNSVGSTRIPQIFTINDNPSRLLSFMGAGSESLVAIVETSGGGRNLVLSARVFDKMTKVCPAFAAYKKTLGAREVYEIPMDTARVTVSGATASAQITTKVDGRDVTLSVDPMSMTVTDSGTSESAQFEDGTKTQAASMIMNDKSFESMMRGDGIFAQPAQLPFIQPYMVKPYLDVCTAQGREPASDGRFAFSRIGTAAGTNDFYFGKNNQSKKMFICDGKRGTFTTFDQVYIGTRQEGGRQVPYICFHARKTAGAKQVQQDVYLPFSNELYAQVEEILPDKNMFLTAPPEGVAKASTNMTITVGGRSVEVTPATIGASSTQLVYPGVSGKNIGANADGIVRGSKAELDRAKALLEENQRKAAELEARKAELDKKQADLEAQQAELDKKLGELGADQEELNKRKAELDAQALALAEERGQINKEVEVLTERLAHASNEITRLTNENSDLSKEVTALEEKRDSLTEENSTLKATIAQTEQKATDLEREKTQVAEQLKQTEEELKTKTDEAQQSATELARVTAERDAQMQMVEERQKRLDELAQEEAELQKKYDELSDSYTELNRQNGELSAQNGALREQIEGLTAERTALQGEINDLRQKLEEQNQTIIDLTERAATAETEARMLREENDRLSTRNDQLEEENRQNQAELTELREENSKAEATIAAQNATIEAQRATIEANQQALDIQREYNEHLLKELEEQRAAAAAREAQIREEAAQREAQLREEAAAREERVRQEAAEREERLAREAAEREEKLAATMNGIVDKLRADHAAEIEGYTALLDKQRADHQADLDRYEGLVLKLQGQNAATLSEFRAMQENNNALIRDMLGALAPRGEADMSHLVDELKRLLEERGGEHVHVGGDSDEEEGGEHGHGGGDHHDEEDDSEDDHSGDHHDEDDDSSEDEGESEGFISEDDSEEEESEEESETEEESESEEESEEESGEESEEDDSDEDDSDEDESDEDDSDEDEDDSDDSSGGGDDDDSGGDDSSGGGGDDDEEEEESGAASMPLRENPHTPVYIPRETHRQPQINEGLAKTLMGVSIIGMGCAVLLGPIGAAILATISAITLASSTYAAYQASNFNNPYYQEYMRVANAKKTAEAEAEEELQAFWEADMEHGAAADAFAAAQTALQGDSEFMSLFHEDAFATYPDEDGNMHHFDMTSEEALLLRKDLVFDLQAVLAMSGDTLDHDAVADLLNKYPFLDEDTLNASFSSREKCQALIGKLKGLNELQLKRDEAFTKVSTYMTECSQEQFDKIMSEVPAENRSAFIQEHADAIARRMLYRTDISERAIEEFYATLDPESRAAVVEAVEKVNNTLDEVTDEAEETRNFESIIEDEVEPILDAIDMTKEIEQENPSSHAFDREVIETNAANCIRSSIAEDRQAATNVYNGYYGLISGGMDLVFGKGGALTDAGLIALINGASGDAATAAANAMHTRNSHLVGKGGLASMVAGDFIDATSATSMLTASTSYSEGTNAGTIAEQVLQIHTSGSDPVNARAEAARASEAGFNTAVKRAGSTNTIYNMFAGVKLDGGEPLLKPMNAAEEAAQIAECCTIDPTFASKPPAEQKMLAQVYFSINKYAETFGGPDAEIAKTNLHALSQSVVNGNLAITLEASAQVNAYNANADQFAIQVGGAPGEPIHSTSKNFKELKGNLAEIDAVCDKYPPARQMIKEGNGTETVVVDGEPRTAVKHLESWKELRGKMAGKIEELDLPDQNELYVLSKDPIKIDPELPRETNDRLLAEQIKQRKRVQSDRERVYATAVGKDQIVHEKKHLPQATIDRTPTTRGAKKAAGKAEAARIVQEEEVRKLDAVVEKLEALRVIALNPLATIEEKQTALAELEEVLEKNGTKLKGVKIHLNGSAKEVKLTKRMLHKLTEANDLSKETLLSVRRNVAAFELNRQQELEKKTAARTKTARTKVKTRRIKFVDRDRARARGARLIGDPSTGEVGLFEEVDNNGLESLASERGYIATETQEQIDERTAENESALDKAARVPEAGEEAGG